MSHQANRVHAHLFDVCPAPLPGRLATFVALHLEAGVDGGDLLGCGHDLSMLNRSGRAWLGCICGLLQRSRRWRREGGHGCALNVPAHESRPDTITCHTSRVSTRWPCPLPPSYLRTIFSVAVRMFSQQAYIRRAVVLNTSSCPGNQTKRCRHAVGLRAILILRRSLPLFGAHVAVIEVASHIPCRGKHFPLAASWATLQRFDEPTG